MNNNKQSSVEWLVTQLKKYDFAHSNLEYYDLKIPMHIFKNITEQTKAMHKEEMIDFGNDLLAQNDTNYIGMPNLAKQYYNQLFGANDENI